MSRKKKKVSKNILKPNNWYMIRFLDHAIGSGSVLTEICGYVYEGSEKEDEIVFLYWRILGESKETEENNREPLTIVKSTIKRKKRISSFEEDDEKRKK